MVTAQITYDNATNLCDIPTFKSQTTSKHTRLKSQSTYSDGQCLIHKKTYQIPIREEFKQT